VQTVHNKVIMWMQCLALLGLVNSNRISASSIHRINIPFFFSRSWHWLYIHIS